MFGEITSNEGISSVKADSCLVQTHTNNTNHQRSDIKQAQQQIQLMELLQP